jgi:hypothetical protein
LSLATSPSRSTSSAASSSSSLSGGAIGGIVAGGVIGVLVLVIIAFLWCKRKTRAGEGDFELIVPGGRTLVGYPDEIAELKVEQPEKEEERPLGAAENKERLIII